MTDDRIEAFQELIAGIYIQQLRLYDLLAVLIQLNDPSGNKMRSLEDLHTKGGTLCPDPALKLE